MCIRDRAIIGLTKSIASDFVKQKIRCNAIAPGTVFTPSWEDRVKQSPDPVKAKKDFLIDLFTGQQKVL